MFVGFRGALGASEKGLAPHNLIHGFQAADDSGVGDVQQLLSVSPQV